MDASAQVGALAPLDFRYCPLVPAAVDAQAEPLLKYGTPPDVPATVRAKVPLDVMGEPATLIMPPVKVWATLVTVPVVGVLHVGVPAVAEVKTCPVVPAAVYA